MPEPSSLIISTAEGTPLGVLQRINGMVQITSATDAFRPMLQRWLTMGLVYWDPPKRDPKQMIARPGDPDFLKRVADYIRTQSNLRFSLS